MTVEIFSRTFENIRNRKVSKLTPSDKKAASPLAATLPSPRQHWGGEKILCDPGNFFYKQP